MDGRQTEIERKFLVQRPPAFSLAVSSVLIRQGYIVTGEHTKEVRVRQIGDDYVLGVKSGAGIEREETEIELTADQFAPLWELTEGLRLEKTRYLYARGTLAIELDVYSGKLDSLVVAEVEFETLEAASAFEPPDWFDREITGHRDFRNSKLARYGLPPGFSPMSTVS